MAMNSDLFGEHVREWLENENEQPLDVGSLLLAERRLRVLSHTTVSRAVKQPLPPPLTDYIKLKIVYHNANPANPQRCFVRLFRKYQSLCPADAPADAFYLQPVGQNDEAKEQGSGHHGL